MKEKILIVEDEASIRSFIVTNLIISDFEIREASTGEEALEICKSYVPDVVVLDIMLPGIDGYKVCEILRAKYSNVGIILLTAKSQDRDKILGLNIGADDYMVKPFNPMELISRINAILRRMHRFSAERTEEIIKTINFSLDTSAQKLFKNNIEIKLTKQEYNLMNIFMKNINKALSRDEILNMAWGEDFFGDYKTVDVHIRRLRKKLEDDATNPQFIQTVWGHGYRFSDSLDVI